MPGDSDGSGSRAYVLPALSDAVRHQALTLGRYHSQGKSRVEIRLFSVTTRFTSCQAFFFAPPIRWLRVGFEAEQYRGKGRLYAENSRLWPG